MSNAKLFLLFLMVAGTVACAPATSGSWTRKDETGSRVTWTTIGLDKDTKHVDLNALAQTLLAAENDHRYVVVYFGGTNCQNCSYVKQWWERQGRVGQGVQFVYVETPSPDEEVSTRVVINAFAPYKHFGRSTARDNPTKPMISHDKPDGSMEISPASDPCVNGGFVTSPGNGLVLKPLQKESRFIASFCNGQEACTRELQECIDKRR